MGWFDDEPEAVYVDATGFLMYGQFTIEWQDIVAVTASDNVLTLNLRGGLMVNISADAFNWCEDINNLIPPSTLCKCRNLQLVDIDNYCDDFVRAGPSDFRRVASAIEDVFWASMMADKIRSLQRFDAVRDLQRFGIDEYCLLFVYVFTYRIMHRIADAMESYVADVETQERCRARKSLEGIISTRIGDLDNIIKAQLQRVDTNDSYGAKEASRAFAFIRMNLKALGVDGQAVLYDNKRNARALGYKFDENEDITPVDVLTCQPFGGESLPFGDPQWAKRRKIIICTDERASLDTWKDGLQIPNVMVMDAQDIIDYNGTMPEELQLKFKNNYPQNGVTYVQHPKQQNVYIDLKSFNTSMLEWKYNELIRLLVALGATEITCEVENNSSSDEKQRYKKNGKVGIDTLVGGGEVDFEKCGASSNAIAFSEKLAHKISKRGCKPHIPENMVFYPFEDSWRLLAEMAMEGSVREYDVCLTYSKDYAVTGQTLTSVGAKVRSKVPGYQFGVEGSFLAEFDNELKQLQSTVWHYHVKFGNGDNETGRGQPQSAQSSDAVAVHKEETADTADSSKKWDKALSIGETIISIAKRMREGQIK